MYEPSTGKGWIRLGCYNLKLIKMEEKQHIHTFEEAYVLKTPLDIGHHRIVVISTAFKDEKGYSSIEVLDLFGNITIVKESSFYKNVLRKFNNHKFKQLFQERHKTKELKEIEKTAIKVLKGRAYFIKTSLGAEHSNIVLVLSEYTGNCGKVFYVTSDVYGNEKCPEKYYFDSLVVHEVNIKEFFKILHIRRDLIKLKARAKGLTASTDISIGSNTELCKGEEFHKYLEKFIESKHELQKGTPNEEAYNHYILQKARRFGLSHHQNIVNNLQNTQNKHILMNSIYNGVQCTASNTKDSILANLALVYGTQESEKEQPKERSISSKPPIVQLYHRFDFKRRRIMLCVSYNENLVVSVGYAICMPNDVYNDDKAKEIAKGRSNSIEHNLFKDNSNGFVHFPSNLMDFGKFFLKSVAVKVEQDIIKGKLLNRVFSNIKEPEKVETSEEVKDSTVID